MKRKVIKQGPSTLMLSLPAQWAKKYNIKRGEHLEVEQYANSLLIKADKPIEVEPIEFDSRELDFLHIKRYLQEIYKLGYDEVKIQISDPKLIPKIQDFISRVMIGYEIISQRQSSITMKSISRGMEKELDNLLRRAFLVTIELAENSYELIDKKQFENLKDLFILEETNDKLTNFCQRILNKKGYSDFKKTSFLFCLIWQLEKIADEYKYICRLAAEHPKLEFLPEVKDLYKEVNDLLRRFYNLFYNYEKKKLMDFTKRSKELHDLSVELHANPKIKHTNVLNKLSMIISYLYNLSGPFIGMVV